MKAIGRKVVCVSFDFGSMASVGVTLYEGLSFEECLKIRSDAIDGYVGEDGSFHKI